VSRVTTPSEGAVGAGLAVSVPEVTSSHRGVGQRVALDVAGQLREAHRRLASEGVPPPGRGWCAAWTAEVDRAIVRSAPPVPTGRYAVLALGGYGRRELCPCSDVDVLVLVERLSEAEQAEIVRRVLYPLWDAGLKVGHAVRSSRQALEAVADDPRTATACLDARLVAGDAGLASALRSGIAAQYRLQPADELRRLRAEDRRRRQRYGDAAEEIEPEVKSGAGGLRDIQSLRWTAGILFSETGLDPLVANGYLSAVDRTRLARAEDLLLQVRVALHLEAGHPQERLTFPAQEAVAGRLGCEPDDLLRALLLSARTVDHAHRAAWRRLDADAERIEREGLIGRRRHRPAEPTRAGRFAIADGVLAADDADLDDPAAPMLLLETLAETGAVLDRRTAGTISRWFDRRSVEPGCEPTKWDEDARRRFLRTLWRGSAALAAIAEVDDAGILAATIPGWARIRGRPQRNPFHRFSLDRHLLHAAAELADLVASEPWAADALERAGDADAVMLGTLLHDIGKVDGEPHATIGAPIAASIALQLGFPAATAQAVERSVRHHLLLPEIATRRDLADPAVARQVAREVGDGSTLAALHLLAVADGRATGPAAWSDWKGELVATLVRKVRAVLGDTHVAERDDTNVRTIHEAERVCIDLGVEVPTLRRHLALLPDRYVAAMPARAIVRHAAMADAPLAPSEVRTRVTAGSQDIDVLDLVAVDRPGTFAMAAGVLAIHRGSVLSADAFTRADGVAVDRVTVRRPSSVGSAEGTRAGTWWAAVEGDLAEAAVGRLAVSARLARAIAARRPDRRVLPSVPTTIEVASDESGGASIVEVRAADRPGLLHVVLRALAELELDVISARIDTVGHEATDVFYVRDAAGRALDRTHAEEVILAVEEAIGG
jgi:[protein-PII] uridylyltransferase